MDVTSLSLEHQSLINIAQSVLDDSTLHYTMQVLHHAIVLGAYEGGDLDILIASTLFHKVISYQKDDIRVLWASDESALFAENILMSIDRFIKEKICLVSEVIKQNNPIVYLSHETLESQVLHDAIKIVGIEKLYTDKARSAFQRKEGLTGMIAKEIKKRMLSQSLR